MLETDFGPGWDWRYSIRVALQDLVKGIALFFLVSAIILLVAAVSFDQQRLWLIPVGVISLVVAGWVGRRAFTQRGELLPSIGPIASLAEIDDVQFSWETPREPQERGKLFHSTFRFQNCVNRSRKVTLRFKVEPAISADKDNAPLRFHKSLEGTLGPGEIVEVSLPLLISPTPPTLISLWVTPSATGGRGRRVRFHEARAFEERVPDSETVTHAVIGAAVGFVAIKFGGGMEYQPRWWNDRPAANDWDQPLPEAVWKTVDTPARELLLAASR